MTAQMDDMMRDCIDECGSCHDICLETLAYCTRTGGKLAEAPHTLLLVDCAEISQTSVNFMLRRSMLHAHTCAACAAVCESCAQDCERFPDDAQMRMCAESCRSCADSCRRVASMARAA